MRVAVTRGVSPRFSECQLTHLSRIPIDLETARAQHREYEACLARLGCRILRLPEAPDLPDSVFVEDTAIVLDEIAVLTRPGAPSRRPETASVARALSRFREIRRIEAPGTLDGGDVFRVGRTLFAGRSSRSNPEGIEQLETFLRPLNYNVVSVPLEGCLHLKSGVTPLDSRQLLINPEWIDPGAFPDAELIRVDPSEPAAANALSVAGKVIYPEGFPRTRGILEDRGIEVVPVPAGELAKAEGGVTCCSLVFEVGEENAAGLI